MEPSQLSQKQRESIKRIVLFVKIGQDNWKKRLSLVAPLFQADKNQKRRNFFRTFTHALKEDLRHHAIVKRWPSCWVSSCEERLKEYTEFYINNNSKPAKNSSTSTKIQEELDITKHIVSSSFVWILSLGGIYLTYRFLNDYINF